MRTVFYLFLALLCPAFSLFGQDVFINEFHYDNAGGDQHEGIEIAGPAGTDLRCFRVYFYEGNDSTQDGSFTLSGTIPDQCNGFGTVWFDVPGIENTSGGAALVFNSTFNCCGMSGVDSVYDFIVYGLAGMVARDGAANGSFAQVVPPEGSGTPVGHSLQRSGNGNQVSNFTWQVPQVSSHGAINPGQTFNGACVAPTATELQFSLLPYGCNTPGDTFSAQVCAVDAAGAVDFSYSGTITLSLGSGSGTLTGALSATAVNGCATFDTLIRSQAGNFTLDASSTGLTGATSGPLIFTSDCGTCPWMTSTLIDACQNPEGNNEILFYNSGSFAIPVEDHAIRISYGTTNPPANTYTDLVTGNAAYVAALNTMAGCPAFVNAADSSIIPPNSTFLVMRFDPTHVYDLSGMCSRAPIYCLFSCDASWDTIGNFLNASGTNCPGVGNTPRYFQTDFTAYAGGASCDIINSYVPCDDLITQGNGDGLTFGQGQQTPLFRWNSCNPILPVEYGQTLRATRTTEGVTLNWQTIQEEKASHFEVLRADDPGGDFTSVKWEWARGQGAQAVDYEVLDADAGVERVFYRLRQVDEDGAAALGEVVEVPALSEVDGVRVWAVEGGIRARNFGEELVWVRVYDLAGRLVGEFEVAGGAEFDFGLDSGVYVFNSGAGVGKVLVR